MNLLIDTRNQGIFLFDSNCTTCSNANKYSFNENSTKGDIDTKNIRHLNVINGYMVYDTVCTSDSSGQGNQKCAQNRSISVITEKSNFDSPLVDGVVGIGRVSPGKNDNQTQFIAGLVNETDTKLVQNFSSYLDVSSKRLHIGTPL